MNHTKMTPGQDPDEFFYIMDSCRDYLNMSTTPEGPTDWQYDDILLQNLEPIPPEHHFSRFHRAWLRHERYESRPEERPGPQLLNVRLLQEELSQPPQTAVPGRTTPAMDDSARAVGSKIRLEVAEVLFGVHIRKGSPIVVPTAATNTDETITMLR